MASIRKAKKAFKKNPYYKGRKVKTFIWHRVVSGGLISRMFTKWRFFHKKLVFGKKGYFAKVTYVGFMDLKKYYERLKI